jgi:hypothetical protein
MRSAFSFLLFLLWATCHAQSLTWDQPEPTGDQSAPEGWQLFADGEQVWQGSTKPVEIESLGLPPGDNEVAVRAYLGDVVSEFSNTITVSIDYPGAPQEVAPDIYFRGVSNQSAGAI